MSLSSISLPSPAVYPSKRSSLPTKIRPVAEPPGTAERCRHERRVPVSQRDAVEKRHQRVERAGHAAVCTSRSSGGSRGADDLPAGRRRRSRRAIAVACDQALDRRIARALAFAGYVDPCDEATTPPTTAPRRLDELLVVDESSHLLGPDDLGELGPGEGGVEEVGVGAQFRQGDGRL